MSRTEEQIVIRRALPTDAPAMAKVHVDAWKTTYAGMIPQDFLDNLSYEKRTALWTDVLSRTGTSAGEFVAVDAAGSVIGFVAAGDARQPTMFFKGEIFAIYLLPAYQGRGIGRRLFERARQHLAEHRIKDALAWVLKDNPATKFYEAMGGTVVGEKMESIGGAELPEVGYGF